MQNTKGYDKEVQEQLQLEYDELKLKRNKVLEIKSKIRAEEATLGLSIKNSLVEFNAKERELQDVQTKIDKPCPYCSKPISFDDLKEVYLNVKKSIDIAKANLDSNQAKSDAAIDNLNQSMKKADEMIASIDTEISKVEQSLRSQMRLKDMLSDIKARIIPQTQALESRIVSITTEISDICDKGLAKTKEYKRLEKTLLEEQEVTNKEIESTQKQLDIAEKVVEILSNSGLKSYVFDSITPALNEKINIFMQTLNPDISVKLSTVKALKSGELREKFSVEVNNLKGSENYAGASGGEKQIVNFAMALAFNSIFRKMRNSADFMWLDEPFESLDEEAVEVVIDLCKLYSSDVGTIFLITHNQAIKDLITQKITIQKKKGVSKII